jgi:hypothetical protein
MPANHPQSVYIPLNYESNTMEISKLDRDEKKELLLQYAKESYKTGHKLTKKEIRKKFHLEVYNYFKDISDYHTKAGIPASMRNYKKEEAKKLIVGYLHKKALNGIYPTRKELEKEFNIHLSTYFRSLKATYDTASINYALVEQNIRNKTVLSHTHDLKTLDEQRKSIKELIKQSVKEGFYPSVHYLQSTLSLSFYNLYDNILEAYSDAGISYERISPIILGKNKERAFTQIIKELFQRMGYIIERISIESKETFNRGADMTLVDKEGNTFLVEIKAYHKDYCITHREFEQLQHYLETEGLQKGIFVTTSISQKCLCENIRFMNGQSIISLLQKYDLSHYIPTIKWVQESRVNSKEKQVHDSQIRAKIIDYVKFQDKMPTKKEIEKKFKLDLRTYFGKVKPFENLLKIINS